MLRRPALTLIALGLVCALPSVAEAAFPGENGKFVFSADFGTPCTGRFCDAPDMDVYSLNADGTELTRLTETGSNSDPAWSPDGTKIAYISFQGPETSGLYLMDADGTNLTRATPVTPQEREPLAWSPDGQQIAFTAPDPSHPEFHDEIVVVNLSTGALTNLTRNVMNDESPAWSPNGDRIAFVSHRDNGVNIWTMDPAGGSLINLTGTTGVSNGVPEWSPDAERIAYHRTGPLERGIRIMNADGIGDTLISGTQDLGDPVWSPDSRLLAAPRFSACGIGCRRLAVDALTLGTGQRGTLFETPPIATFSGLDWQPIASVPPPSNDAGNRARACAAERARLGEVQFRSKYGTNKNGSNVFGKCVSQKP